MRRLPISKTH